MDIKIIAALSAFAGFLLYCLFVSVVGFQIVVKKRNASLGLIWGSISLGNLLILAGLATIMATR